MSFFFNMKYLYYKEGHRNDNLLDLVQGSLRSNKDSRVFRLGSSKAVSTKFGRKVAFKALFAFNFCKNFRNV